ARGEEGRSARPRLRGGHLPLVERPGAPRAPLRAPGRAARPPHGARAERHRARRARGAPQDLRGRGERARVSIATCPNCGAAWNVAGITAPAVGCQRCGAQIPLAPQAAAPAPAWQPPALSGEGIVAVPADPGTPLGENAIPCAHCGTVLDAAGLPVGVGLRCGRCGGLFPRPSAQQVMAVLQQQQAYAPPPQPGFSQPGFAPQGQQGAPQLSSQQAATTKALETSGELELSLKPTTRCPGCGKEYYDEELPPPDDKR